MNARRAATVLAGLSVLLLAVACQRMPGQPLASDRPIPSDRVLDFDVLFNENCVGCHGPGGRNGAAPPLNEPLYLALADAATLRTIVSTGIRGTSMPAFSRGLGGPLTDEQIGILADGMHSRWAKPSEFQNVELPPLGSPEPGAPAAAPAGDPQRAEAAYQAFCARCHGADGTGGPDGRSVVDSAYLGLTSDYGLRTIVVVGRTDFGMPDWRGDAPGRPMTASEIDDVVAWLKARRAK